MAIGHLRILFCLLSQTLKQCKCSDLFLTMPNWFFRFTVVMFSVWRSPVLGTLAGIHKHVTFFSWVSRSLLRNHVAKISVLSLLCSSIMTVSCLWWLPVIWYLSSCISDRAALDAMERCVRFLSGDRISNLFLMTFDFLLLVGMFWPKQNFPVTFQMLVMEAECGLSSPLLFINK